jgi:homoserine dehydrogenase
LSGNSFHTSGSSPTARCRVGLLGFGTVGSAIARRLALDPAAHPSQLELTHIFDRRAASKREAFERDAGRPPSPRRGPGTGESAAIARLAWTPRVDDVLTGDVDIVVEAIGGTGDALTWTRAALLAGKSVVTCNKQLIARHGPALLELAARQGRQVRFEAAVGGAMPIVRAIGDGLAGDRLTRIVAILNGTTNAVLSAMEASGCSLAQALDDARARGYAEADPSADLDGIDARAKLAILCALGFGLRVDPEEIEAQTAAGVTAADFGRVRRRGGTIRQLACASYDRDASLLTAWVAPSPVSLDSVFARATGPQNAALVTGEYSGDCTISGAGAGGDATAVAVIGDLLAIARDRFAIVPAPRLARPARIQGLTPGPGRAERAALRDVGGPCVDRGPGNSVDRRQRAEAV